MMRRPYLPDEHRREQREDKCLNEADQHFEEHDAERHWNRAQERDHPAPEQEHQTDLATALGEDAPDLSKKR